MNDRIMLRVAEAHHRDAGKDIARIDRNTMEQMDILSGDIILVVGKEKACAIAGPGYPEDQGTEIIRIDGNIRANARVGIDDKIYIQKSTPHLAKKVVLAPTQQIRLVGGPQYLLRLLEGRPLIKGQHLRLDTISNPLSFIVTSTLPYGPVVISRNTRITVKEEIIEQSEDDEPNCEENAFSNILDSHQNAIPQQNINEDIFLHVAEAHKRDADRDIARIDRDLMEKLGILSGDVILVVGKEKACAIAAPGYPEDASLELIRIDGNTRMNAHVEVDDKVNIEKSSAQIAKRVVLVPTEQIRLVGGPGYLIRLLEARPLMKGQYLKVKTVSNPLSFIVTSTLPNGPVIISRTTKLVVKESIQDESEDKELKEEEFEFNVMSSNVIPDIEKELEGLHRLTLDTDSEIRWRAANSIVVVFPKLPDKKQAWNDLLRLMQDEYFKVRWSAALAVGHAFSYVTDKKQAWKDLHSLIHNENNDFRWSAADALGIAFLDIPDKEHAWEDLHMLTLDKNVYTRRAAATSLGSAFPYILEREKAWEDIHRLTIDENCDVRWGVALTLGSVFSHVSNKTIAWEDLHKLTVDEDYDVRWSAALAVSDAFPYIPDKIKALEDLHRLTKDNNEDVRVYSNYSLGRVSIFKATEAESEENYRKELEKAIEFFEKSSIEATNFNPASFCLPFYMSFYKITFNKQESEPEVDVCLEEAKSAIEDSDSKEELLEAIENLSSALREAQKSQEMDFDAKKCGLNAYKRYCERAAHLLNTIERNAPYATKLIRKGLPIIDDRIKEIIAEIHGSTKKIYDLTKDTPLKEFGRKTCTQTKELSLKNPLDLDIGLNRIINTAKEWCDYIQHDENKKSVCEKLKSLKNMDIYEKVMGFSEIFEFISTNLNIPRMQTVHVCEPQKENVRVAVIQFCYLLTKSFPLVIENKEAGKAKIFSGLDIAKKYGANIACLPELCLCEEWIHEIEMNYPDMIVISGGYYKDNKNICPVLMKSDITLPCQLKITPAAPEDPEMWESGMISGDRIYKYETQFGKFVILICRDFERFAHFFRESNVDFIFCPEFNEANERFHLEANNHVTKNPSYILMANTGVFGGSSIFAQLNKNHFYRLVGEDCKDEGDNSFKLCEAKKGRDEVIIADFNLTHKSIQIPSPSESSKEKRSVTYIKKLPII